MSASLLGCCCYCCWRLNLVCMCCEAFACLMPGTPIDLHCTCRHLPIEVRALAKQNAASSGHGQAVDTCGVTNQHASPRSADANGVQAQLHRQARVMADLETRLQEARHASEEAVREAARLEARCAAAEASLGSAGHVGGAQSRLSEAEDAVKVRAAQKSPAMKVAAGLGLVGLGYYGLVWLVA